MTTQPEEVKHTNTHKKNHKFTFDFSTTEDLFISAKGRELRNKQKKLDKIIQTEIGIRRGEITPSDTQKEMISKKQSLHEEIKFLQDLIELYIKSNPNYIKKETVEVPKQPEVIVSIEPVVCYESIQKAFKLLADLTLIKATVESPHHLVVVPGPEFQSISDLYNHFEKVKNFQLNNTWDKELWNKHAESFAKAFTLLFQRSQDKVCHKENGVSFAEVAAMVESQVAALPNKIKDNSADEVHTYSQQTETTDVVTASEVEISATAIVAEQTQEVAATTTTEETKENTATQQHRGEKRQRGEYRPRGNGEWRGDRGDRGNRGGRGGRAPREDDDGFTVETGEKPKPRGRGGYRGSRGGERGERGDRGNERGEYRGPREGTRGGKRPREEGTTQPAQSQNQQ